MEEETKEEFEKLQKEAAEFDWVEYNSFFEKLVYRPWFTERPPIVQEAMKAMPFCKYYTNREDQTKAYRIYGVGEDGEQCYFHVVEAKLFRVNLILLTAEDLVAVDHWSETHLNSIRACDDYHSFIRPDGWMALAFRLGFS